MKKIDFLAIGDIVTDAFIELKDAEVHCNVDNENCMISMPFGEKIPYKDVVVVPAVGNSPNASVAAARLGLASGLITNVGNDAQGTECLDHLEKEGVATDYITRHDGIKTNYHYVLRYGAERTILIKHEQYPYQFPAIAENPKWVYLSSLADGSEDYHEQLIDWLDNNPDVQFAFQPGTQIRFGVEKMKRVYERANALFCNKDEARVILNLPHADYPELHAAMRVLGPEIVCITDGPDGATISNSEHGWFIPMYPDPKPPVDRTGAGDSCSSTTVAMIAQGKDLPTAVMYGVTNSMSVVQYIGAQAGLLSKEKIEEYLNNAPSGFEAKELW